MWSLLLLACRASPVNHLVPELALPEQPWILFESITLTGRDRSGGWRFRLDADGCYRVARNEALRVDGAALTDPNPALFWNTEWPPQPHGCLTEDEQETVHDAVRDAALHRLSPSNALPEGVQINDGSLERWTVVTDAGVHTLLIEHPRAVSDLGVIRQLGPWGRAARAVTQLHAVIRGVASDAIRRQRAAVP